MNIRDLFGTLAPQSAPNAADENPFFNRREAGWAAVGGALQGLGTGLMTRDWSKALEVNNAALDQYQQSKYRKYTAQQLMEEAAARKAEREQKQAEIDKRNEWLKSISNPQTRAMLEANPGLIDNYIAATDPAFQKPDKPQMTADMQNYLFAQENPEFARFLNQGQAGGGSPNWGMTVVPLKNKKTGETVVGQLNQSQGGVFINGQPADPNEWAYDPGAVAQDKAAGTAEGKAIGEARGDLPGAIKQAETTTKKIDDLAADKTLDAALGWTSYLPDKMVPSDVIAIRGKVDELMGGAFLEARTMLKGGGQITDYEGMRAERAYARMERAIQAGDPKVFREALTDFKQAVADGVEKLRATARVPGAGSGNTPSSDSGAGEEWTIVNGKPQRVR